MSTIDQKVIKKIAHLARLDISEQDIPQYKSNLTKILELVDKISDINTENLEPMAHPLEQQTQPLRPDEVTETNMRDTFQNIAPQTEAGVYLVPKVIES